MLCTSVQWIKANLKWPYLVLTHEIVPACKNGDIRYIAAIRPLAVYNYVVVPVQPQNCFQCSKVQYQSELGRSEAKSDMMRSLESAPGESAQNSGFDVVLPIWWADWSNSERSPAIHPNTNSV